MKKILSYSTVGLMLLVYPAVVRAQNSIVPWSSFTAGSAVATSANTVVASAVGQMLVGEAGIDNVRTESGFLAILLSHAPLVAVEDATALPMQYELRQNYPNPFNPSTTLEFDLPEAADIRLVVYDLLGREVVRLVQQRLEAGSHQLIWNGRDAHGRELPTGMYIVRMTSPNYTRSIKMLLLK